MFRKTKLVSLLFFVLSVCPAWGREKDKLPLKANWVSPPVTVEVARKTYRLGMVKDKDQKYLAATTTDGLIVRDFDTLNEIFLVQYVYLLSHRETNESLRINQLDYEIGRIETTLNMSYLTDAVLFLRDASSRALAEAIVAALSGGSSTGRTIAKMAALSGVKSFLKDPVSYAKGINYLTMQSSLNALQRARKNIADDMRAGSFVYERTKQIQTALVFGLSKSGTSQVLQGQLYLEQGGKGDLISQMQKVYESMAQQLIGKVTESFKHKALIDEVILGTNITDFLIQNCPAFAKYVSDTKNLEKDLEYETSQYYIQVIEQSINNWVKVVNHIEQGAEAHHSSQKQKYTLKIVEKSLGGFSPEGRAYTVSPDCSKLAYVNKDLDQKERIVVNELEGEPHDSIEWLMFSPDSKRLVYGARDKGQNWIVLDGSKQKNPYDLIGGEVFSPNSRRFAFIATENPGTQLVRSFIVLDGIDGRSYRDIPHAPLFSPDSSRLAYIVKDGDKRLLVSDRFEGPKYDYVGQLIFSLDSRKLAYVVQDQADFRVIVNGHQGPLYELIWGLNFSPDSSQLIYTALSEKGWLLIVDSFKGRNQFRISDYTSPTIFSPDGKKLAWVTNVVGREILVVDGKNYGQPYDKIENVIFSPNGERMAYKVHQKRREFIVIDGVEGKEYDFVGLPVFSPDSAHAAYLAVSGEKHRMVIDGIEGCTYDHIGHRAPVQHILPSTFDPKSMKVTYWALKGDKWYLVVGSEEVWHCDEFVLGDVPPLYWNKEGCLYALGVRSQQILLVEVRFAGMTMMTY